MTQTNKRIRPLYAHFAVFGLYLLVAVIITWPLVTVIGSRFAGFGYSDAYEMAHHIWWFKHALQTGQPLFYQSMMGYPEGIEGITLWAHPLQFFPAWLLAFVLPLAAAYNLTMLLSLALVGWTMYWLAYYLLEGKREPALLAGLIFMAFPTMQAHLGAGHAGLLVQWPVPLYVYALFRLREMGGWRWIAFGALCFFLSASGHTLQVVYVLMPITALFWLALLARRKWRSLGRLTLSVLIGMVVLAVFLIPVASATLGTAAYTDAGGAVRYSADLLAAVTPSFFHPVFGNFEYTHRVLGINIDEGYAYVGIVAAVLSAVAVWKMRAARWWLLLAAVVYILSLGPLLKLFDQPARVMIADYDTYITLPGAILDSLPLFSLARTPGRYNFVLGLALAVMAGYGLAYLLPRLRNARWIVVGVLAAFILFEYQAFWPLPTVTADVPEAVSALSERDDVRAVLDVPWGNLVAAKQGMYLQTAHEHALIGGHVTRQTPVSPAKLTLLETTLDPALLRAAGADVVIVHREYDAENALYDRARDQLGEPLHDDARFAVFLTPRTDEPPVFTALPLDEMDIESSAEAYVYAPESGWINFSADFTANGRSVLLTLDGQVIRRWMVDGEQVVDVPVALSEGFHTLSLAVDAPCPRVYSEALRCRSLQVTDAAEFEFAAAAFAPVEYGGGGTLVASRVLAPDENQLTAWLWWQFSAPRNENEIRFVHVLNENGELVAQSDITLGVQPAGESFAEAVILDIANLPPGSYRIYTGWYTYPDTVRFPVLSDVAGKENNVALIGEFTVET